MDSLEIQHVLKCDSQLQCRSCLSVGRKLSPLGRYTNIYMALSVDVVYFNFHAQDIQICWECESVLKKICSFQEQLKKANKLFYNNQNFSYETLSNLASITLNDKHQIIYLSEYNVQRNCLLEDDCKNSCTEKDLIRNIEEKKDPFKNVHEKSLNIIQVNKLNKIPLINSNIQIDNNNTKHCSEVTHTKHNKDLYSNYISEDDNFEYSNHKILTLKDTILETEKSKKRKSRWAIQRAAQNKKPKFKIVSTDMDKVFIKVLINNDELGDCMAKERDSEYYKSKRFQCETCVLGFVEEKQWFMHNKIHHCDKISGYTCDICETKLIDKRHLLEHIVQNYNVHKCSICQYICRNKEIRFWHFQNKHKKVFQCLKCGLMFCNRREFFMHYKDWHEKYICNYCGISFKMRYSIKEHIRKQHSPFTCVPCNKTFARYNGLWLHKKLAHSPPAPPAYCVECDTTYKDIYRYKWHLCNSAKHTPKKKVSVSCPDCPKTFTKQIYMKEHYNLMHLKLFKHRCEPCNKNFIRNAELVKHRRRKHEGIMPPKDKMCYLCGRGFTTNKILRNHIRTHERSDSKIQAEDTSKEKQT